MSKESRITIYFIKVASRSSLGQLVRGTPADFIRVEFIVIAQTEVIYFLIGGTCSPCDLVLLSHQIY
jgi:hypothetical protein